MRYQLPSFDGLRSSAWILGLSGVFGLAAPTARGWQVEPALLPPPPATVVPSPQLVTPASNEVPVPADVAREQEANSEPERIARLQRNVLSDASRLEKLKQQLEDPHGDYAQAEATFNRLDARLVETKKALQHAQSSGDALQIEQRQEELAEIEKQWSLAKKDFQLALEQRKAQQASVPTLQTKIEKDHQALERLRGNELAPATPQPSAPQADPGRPQPSPVGGPVSKLAPPPGTNGSVPPGSAAGAPMAVVPLANADAPPPADAARGSGTQPAPAAIGPAGSKPKPDERIVKAEQAAAKSAADAEQAEHSAATVTERLDILRQDIELERKLRAVAAGKTGVARDQLAELNAQLDRKLAAGEDVAGTRWQIRQAESALVGAQSEAEQIGQHLDQLQTEFSNVRGEQVAALQRAEQKRQEADAASQAVAELNSPFTTYNILRWVSERGVTILVILAVLAIVLWAGRLLEGRLVSLIAYRSSRGEREEREKRAQTLVSVLHNALRTVALGTAAVMILDKCSVAVGPILGGAAVVGLAVAFGAQSLIKDYFTGFMVLMEQQYMIGDVIKIGDTTAQVERITLRMTVLRDLEGRVHFIPHGQIATVTNLTHEWSRAVFDIGVAYQENVDRVIDVLLELGRALRRDPRFAHMILDNPVMLGVDALAESAVVIKFFLKTRPLNQWDVKRELLRRIKMRFDELGIEIPLPHRKLYFVNSQASLSSPAAERVEPSARSTHLATHSL